MWARSILFASIFLAACSWTDALKLLTPAASQGISADAEVTVGKKEEDNDVNTTVQVGGDKSESQTAEKIVNNTDERMSPWVLLLIVLLAGWAIPGPYEMVKGIRKVFRKQPEDSDTQ